MVDFLNDIKEKLENISSLALNIKDKNQFSYEPKPADFKAIPEIEKQADRLEPEKTDQELILDKKEETKEIQEYEVGENSLIEIPKGVYHEVQVLTDVIILELCTEKSDFENQDTVKL